MILRRIMAPVMGTLLLGGCGGGEPPAKPRTPLAAAPATPAPAAVGAAAVRPLDPGAGPMLPALTYDSKSRRDPFSPIVLTSAPKGLNVTAARLVGIVKGGRGPLALVEGADGVGYILKIGDAFGNGRVTGITGTSVTFAVSSQSGQGSTAVTLRLAFD